MGIIIAGKYQLFVCITTIPYTPTPNMHMDVPDAVAGPTPFSSVRALMDFLKSGSRRNAFFEHISTCSSELLSTRSCSLGLNLPLWARQANVGRGEVMCQVKEDWAVWKDQFQ